jgi:formylglycine-generating enzyme required for sulfatase activity
MLGMIRIPAKGAPARGIPAMPVTLPGSVGAVVVLILVLAALAGWRRAEPEDLTGWRAERLAAFQVWQAANPAREIWDHPDAPVLVTLPPGSFLQGSPESEQERFPDEPLQRPVSIRHPVAIGKYPVTRGEYARFIQDSGYKPRTICRGYAGETELLPRWHFSWRRPGFEQTNRDPAVCISWYDAKAYVDWLSRRTGKPYRLPTEAEWEYAARAGTRTARWWGDDPAKGCDAANEADLSAKDRFTDWEVANCRDGALFTAPVGSYRPNGFGLYDMLGNVWQWVEDCAADGGGTCPQRVMRGGSWHSNPRYVRSAVRRIDGAEIGYAAYGIRVARDP